MGYTTDFMGQIDISPPLSREEQMFLTEFAGTRRMDRKQGPYFVGGSGSFGQGDDPDVIDHNWPPLGQPGLWCQWVPTEDGNALTWDEGEKFYEAECWMKYIIEHFLKPDCIAKEQLPFLQANHHCSGEIEAQGESSDDHWWLWVEDNKVAVVGSSLVRTTANEVDWDVEKGASPYRQLKKD